MYVLSVHCKLSPSCFFPFQPPFSSTRFCGMVVVAYLWSSVLWLAIPEEQVGGINWRWLIVFVPLACALGMNRVTIIDFMNVNFCLCSIVVVFFL